MSIWDEASDLRQPLQDTTRNKIFKVDSIHGFLRHRHPGSKGPLDRTGCADNHLRGHDIISLRGVERISIGVFFDVHVLVCLHPRGHGPQDLSFTIDIE